MAVDPTLLPACNQLESKQSTTIESVTTAINRIFEYLRSNKSNSTTFYASDRVLRVQTDGAYLSLPNSGSTSGVVMYLGNKTDTNLMNGLVAYCSATIKFIVSSTGECEYASAFLGAKMAESLSLVLTDLGFQQEAIDITVDNTCVKGLADHTTKQKCTRHINMRINWLRDRVRQGKFTITWRPGEHIKAANFMSKSTTVKEYMESLDYLITRKR